MLDSLIVPLFVTADLPPRTELAEFGELLADMRQAIGAAVTVRYGDVGVAPAVFAIRDRDVRERTPDTALYVDTRHAARDLVTVTRPYL